jgi:hypothetical protein
LNGFKTRFFLFWFKNKAISIPQSVYCVRSLNRKQPALNLKSVTECTRLWRESRKQKDHFQDRGVDGRMGSELFQGDWPGVGGGVD